MHNSPIPAVCATVALLLGACSSGKATEAECKQFSQHWETLMSRTTNPAEAHKTEQVASNQAKALLAECLKEGTSAQVQCALAADSMEALQSCTELR